MQRITIAIDDDLAETFDALLRERAYRSRSEAMRDLLRGSIEQWRQDSSQSEHCVASLSYVFDRRTRNLAQRLAEFQHDAHDIVAATTVVRIDHYHSLESVTLKGRTGAVRAFADRVRAERGVRFGAINLLDVEADPEHDSAHAHHHHEPHHSPRG
ncbi:MAG TPA: nickel-responsive transcriptional regulator NikR [Novosphingobium sp.]|nr:nickel-responsive transcriptional regulator NikR [Novosphingobium sp.]